MFYDDVFKAFMEGSPFSQTATLICPDALYWDSTIGRWAARSETGETEAYELKGIFCSGNYGTEDYDKGYTTKKSEKRQSFQIALGSLPDGLDAKALVRQTLIVDGETYRIRDVTGNKSGILVLELVPGAESWGG